MPNSIVLAKTYVNLLDEVYKQASVTNDLTTDPAMVRAGATAKTVLYPKLAVGGLGDYDRNSGYTSAAVNVTWGSVEFDYDRGAKIMIDAMDNQETFNVAFGRASAELIRTRVAPENDAYTFAKLAGLENISVATPATYADGVAFLEALIIAKTKMDEDEVPEEDRILYATPTLLNSVVALDTTKSREVLNSFVKRQAVPQSRFYTAIDLLDGKSAGEEAGHYRKAETGKDINFMVVHKPAVIKIDKHVASDIIPANLNADADADIVKYRKYGVVEGYENKRAGI